MNDRDRSHEERARAAKAYRLSRPLVRLADELVDRGATPDDAVRQIETGLLREGRPDLRRRVADLAGIPPGRPPSTATWGVAVALLREEVCRSR